MGGYEGTSDLTVDLDVSRATRRGDLRLLKFFGEEVLRQTNNNGILFMAAEMGHLKLLRYFHDIGVKFEGKQGYKALSEAVDTNDDEMIDFFISIDIDINERYQHNLIGSLFLDGNIKAAVSLIKHFNYQFKTVYLFETLINTNKASFFTDILPLYPRKITEPHYRDFILDRLDVILVDYQTLNFLFDRKDVKDALLERDVVTLNKSRAQP